MCLPGAFGDTHVGKYRLKAGFLRLKRYHMIFTSAEMAVVAQSDQPLLVTTERFHLQNRGIVIAEMIIRSLPEVRMGSCGDLDPVRTDLEAEGFSCPFHFSHIHFAILLFTDLLPDAGLPGFF